MGLRFEGTIRIACLTLAAVAVAYLGVFLLPRLSRLLVTTLLPLLAWVEWKQVLDNEDRNFLRLLIRKAVNGVLARTAGRFASDQTWR
jgi:hypothetical protein